MIDKFDLWQYRENANCWDFVRAFLIERAGIDAADVPRFGICPDDKKAMTKASAGVRRSFSESGPEQFAIACHYVGRVLYHVGVVDGGIIRHTGKQTGTRKDSIKEFERLAGRTIYMLHNSLWQD